ncbi:MAG: transcription elongation factor GreA [Anaerolineae bacterium]|nr:transcription elongation factor GreA [Anaerolineae bacterium]
MNKRPTYPMTAAKLKELQVELKQLVDVQKPELAVRLKTAIAMGDLKENADYHAAKEDQAFLEGRIQKLTEMIQGAEVVSEDHFRTVTVIEEGIGEEETFLIVSPTEANPAEGRISYESPLGAALQHGKPGQTVRIDTPAGETVFRIIRVS